MSQLTLYNAARPPPGPPELRRLRSVGRVPPPGILRRFTPARNRAGSSPFCILHSSFCLSPLPPPGTAATAAPAATQERRLQAADGSHNPANRLTTPEPLPPSQISHSEKFDN